VSPEELEFGSCQVDGKSTSKTATLSNPRGNGTATIASIMIQGSRDFSVASTTCGTRLAGGSSCTISVAFRPSRKNSLTGKLVITDNASNSPQIVYLDGSGE
jgi:hypothetical protein